MTAATKLESAAGIDRARVAVVTVQGLVPAGSGRRVARIDRAVIEIRAIRAVDCRRYGYLRGASLLDDEGGGESKGADGHDPEERFPGGRSKCHVLTPRCLFLETYPEPGRRQPVLDVLFGEVGCRAA